MVAGTIAQVARSGVVGGKRSRDDRIRKAGRSCKALDSRARSLPCYHHGQIKRSNIALSGPQLSSRGAHHSTTTNTLPLL